jgi:hypothetical protein
MTKMAESVTGALDERDGPFGDYRTSARPATVPER